MSRIPHSTCLILFATFSALVPLVGAEVEILSPEEGETFGFFEAQPKITTSVVEPSGTEVLEVEFFIAGESGDQRSLGVDTKKPFTGSAHSVMPFIEDDGTITEKERELPSGSWTLTAEARFSDGSAVQSDPVTIIVEEPENGEEPTEPLVEHPPIGTFGEPPSISFIGEQSIEVGETRAVDFDITDPDTDLEDLTVEVETSKDSILEKVEIIGIGGDRAITFTGATEGITTLTITVTDPSSVDGSTPQVVERKFDVKVGQDRPVDPPLIDEIVDILSAPIGGVVKVPYSVSDTQTPADQLAILATSDEGGVVEKVNVEQPDASGAGNLVIHTGTTPGTATVYVEVIDGDGESTAIEFAVTIQFGTSPISGGKDSDDDGIPDKVERDIGTDPNNPDTDGDGLDDGVEANGSTDPTDPDTDGDNLNDGEERLRGTDPLEEDTDGDGAEDGEEVDAGSDPLNPDSDGDGKTDGQEIGGGTDPTDPDSDGDGVDDGEDPNPGDAGGDADGDGATDGEEFAGGTDMEDPKSHPAGDPCGVNYKKVENAKVVLVLCATRNKVCSDSKSIDQRSWHVKAQVFIKDPAGGYVDDPDPDSFPAGLSLVPMPMETEPDSVYKLGEPFVVHDPFDPDGRFLKEVDATAQDTEQRGNVVYTATFEDLSAEIEVLVQAVSPFTKPTGEIDPPTVTLKTPIPGKGKQEKQEFLAINIADEDKDKDDNVFPGGILGTFWVLKDRTNGLPGGGKLLPMDTDKLRRVEYLAPNNDARRKVRIDEVTLDLYVVDADNPAHDFEEGAYDDPLDQSFTDKAATSKVGLEGVKVVTGINVTELKSIDLQRREGSNGKIRTVLKRNYDKPFEKDVTDNILIGVEHDAADPAKWADGEPKLFKDGKEIASGIDQFPFTDSLTNPGSVKYTVSGGGEEFSATAEAVEKDDGQIKVWGGSRISSFFKELEDYAKQAKTLTNKFRGTVKVNFEVTGLSDKKEMANVGVYAEPLRIEDAEEITWTLGGAKAGVEAKWPLTGFHPATRVAVIVIQKAVKRIGGKFTPPTMSFFLGGDATADLQGERNPAHQDPVRETLFRLTAKFPKFEAALFTELKIRTFLEFLVKGTATTALSITGKVNDNRFLVDAGLDPALRLQLELKAVVNVWIFSINIEPNFKPWDVIEKVEFWKDKLIEDFRD